MNFKETREDLSKMQKMRLGRTGLQVGRTAFGALPIQRLGVDDAVELLRKAHAGGIDFFDSARGYTDSEEKLGRAFSDSGLRGEVLLATKTHAKDRKALLDSLETSLSKLQTDHIDLFQLHNPEILPDPADPDGTYAGLMEAKARGWIRHVGVTNHRLAIALEAAESGHYDTVQYPLNLLSTKEELRLVDVCRERDVGFIAMKAMSGGLLSSAAAAFAYLRQFENVLPIWGIQREAELAEFLALEKDPPVMDVRIEALVEKDRAELSGAFCRACGYCMPCPEGIPISMAARMSLLLTRMPAEGFLTPEWEERMESIERCQDCGQCTSRCPYHLDTPALLKANLAEYRKTYRYHRSR